MSTLIDTSFDGHIHTSMCHHAVGTMNEYVAAGVQRGLKTMCFLEHMETEINYPFPCWLEDTDFNTYFAEGERLKKVYKDKINIRLGVELGCNVQALDRIQQRLAQFPFERVGLSCHFYYDAGHHRNLLSRKPEGLAKLASLGADKVLTAYFDNLTTAVQELDCDVLCHLDAALRHLPGIHFNNSHKKQIGLLLDALKKKSMALEINTSGFDYRGMFFPAPWIIRAALDRGIPLQAGSDAHKPGDVARYFDRLPSFLASLEPA